MRAKALQVGRDIVVGVAVVATRVWAVVVWVFGALVSGVRWVADPLVRWSLLRQIAREDELLQMAMRHALALQSQDMLRKVIERRRQLLGLR